MKEINMLLRCSSVDGKANTRHISFDEIGAVIRVCYTVDELYHLGILSLNQYLDFIKTNEVLADALDPKALEGLCCKRVEICYRGYSLYLSSDKRFDDIFNDLNSTELNLIYIDGVGKGYEDSHRYKYIIHSDESVHRFTPHPHVHVKKDGKDIRFGILDGEPMDKLVYPHKRDLKRISQYIDENRAKFIDSWRLSNSGYIVPESIDEIN